MLSILAALRARSRRISIAAAGLLALVAIMPAQAMAACFDGASERLVVELLFGRNIGARPGVSEADFRRFVDKEVTPRFPDGFTLLDTRGQWRDTERNAIVREAGKHLMVALDDEANGLPRVREVIEAYKVRFKQQSVGLIARRACVAF